ncbi:hypothetical protein Tco_0085592 [Tanacetum coccineum]
MDASDLAREEVMSLRTTILGQMSEIRELHAADHRRQAVISDMLKADQRRSAEMREDKWQYYRDRLPHYRDSRDPVGGPARQSLPGGGFLVAVIDLIIDANRNGDDSHTSGTGGRRTERIVRECTYQDFMKMETIFRISNCPVENQVKFSTCTLLAGALTWWNSHVMTVSHDAAYANVIVRVLSTSKLITLHKIDQRLFKLEIVIINRWNNYSIFIPLDGCL